MEVEERRKIGLKYLKTIDGEVGDEVIKALDGVAGDIGNYILEFAFGEIYNRKSLNLKHREMITITILLSQGGTEPQLKVHINGALNVGLSQEEILETFIQCIPYVGFPKVLNAVDLAKNGYNWYWYLWILNEAFAAQSIACIRQLGINDMDKVNPKGGAIALGHPVGASGNRILTTLIYELIENKGNYGIASLCIGGGMGAATLIKNANSNL